MYINIISLTEILTKGREFRLPSNLVRYIEFENVVAILLDEDGRRDKVVGIKFSQGGRINNNYIAWEFQVVDGLNETHRIDYFVMEERLGRKVLVCHGEMFDVVFYVDPENGEIIQKMATKWT